MGYMLTGFVLRLLLLLNEAYFHQKREGNILVF